jgi:hypothetical protein
VGEETDVPAPAPNKVSTFNSNVKMANVMRTTIKVSLFGDTPVGEDPVLQRGLFQYFGEW